MIARYRYLDFLRGLSIILMVIYHFAYNLVLWNIIPSILLFNPLLDFLQVLFASLFIAISGISSSFSRSNLRRGIKMLLFAAVISIATYLFDPSLMVRFGIIHFMGSAAIILHLLRPLLEKANIHGVFWLALFFISRILLNRTFDIDFLWPLGITSLSFGSADYFPIFPWIFMYFFGFWLSKYVREERMPPVISKLKGKFFEKCGTLSLWIYLLHQPLLIGIIYAIAYILK